MARTKTVARNVSTTSVDDDNSDNNDGGPAAIVLGYLIHQNRPFSATDLIANLATKVKLGKTALMKVLKDLQDGGKIETRTAGKQVVYHVKQIITPECSTEALTRLDTEIDTIRSTTSTLRGTEKTLRTQLSALQQQASSSPAALRALVATKMEELDGLRAALEASASVVRSERDGGEHGGDDGDGDGDDDPAASARLDGEIRKWQRTARRRKRIVTDMWAMIEDGVKNSGGNVKDLKELFCLDD